MVNRDDIPLILLYTDSSSSIDGATRFQKLIFLAQQEAELPNVFEFEAYKYGPYSPDLHHTLHQLEAQGLLKQTSQRTADGNVFYRYSIEPKGIQRVQESLGNDTNTIFFESLQEVKRRFRDWTNNRLLQYTYNKYEEYTTQSELDTEDLHDPYLEIEQTDDHTKGVMEVEANATDEPTWHTRETDDVPEVAVPQWADEYLDSIAGIALVSEVYYEERSDKPDRLITVLADRDFDTMERIYCHELELRDRFPDADVAFRVTVADALEPFGGATATRIHSEG